MGGACGSREVGRQDGEKGGESGEATQVQGETWVMRAGRVDVVERGAEGCGGGRRRIENRGRDERG